MTHVERGPTRPPAKDGLYPRCVWCNGENCILLVFAYSVGEVPCAAAPGCGRFIPESHVKIKR